MLDMRVGMAEMTSRIEACEDLQVSIPSRATHWASLVEDILLELRASLTLVGQ